MEVILSQGKMLRLLLTFSIVIFFSAFQSLCQKHSNFELLADGVIVTPNKKLSGQAETVQLQFMADGIIHVIASPEKGIKRKESLSVIARPNQVLFTVYENGDSLWLITKKLKSLISRSSGTVSFYSIQDKRILSERDIRGRDIDPVVFEGEKLFRLRQKFETESGDAIYGLGQHQEDAWNYMGKQVQLFQNNTEVAIPFLISPRNYGILWDNYSYTLVGDTRTFLPLSHLKLFDHHNQQGWLTATYCNNRFQQDNILIEKAESEISYPYVNDSKLKLPAAFTPERGMVSWNGAISSEVTGIHKLKIRYAGYFKLWLNDSLLMDHWRQAWNPGTRTLELHMEKNRQYKVKIEWIPDGGESYLDLSYLPPIPEEDINSFAFDSEAGQQVNYYFLYGQNADELISGYRFLTGKAVMLPSWAWGFWQSRERYKSQAEILNTVKEFRAKKIPLDNLVLDWFYWKEDQWGSQEFDTARFPNPVSMIDSLHHRYNTQFMISVWPKFYEGTANYNYFDNNGWLYRRNIADRQRDWVGKGYVSTFYDAFNENARKAFWQLIHKKIFSKGIDAWWMDASEPDILSNVSVNQRKGQMTPLAIGTATEYLNAYPLQNARGIYEGQRKDAPDQRVFLLTRSGFSGSQRYAAAIWSGDIASRWEDMKAQISAGCNFSISGLPYWTMDIGGFSVERRYEKPSAGDLEEWRELQSRWFQFGAFTPLFRVHGQFPFREMFHIAPSSHAAYRSMLYYDHLRYRLMPYIYSCAGAVYHKDYTIMRPLFMDFSMDKKTWEVGDQYMFGQSILINPVYTYKATSRDVYLPAGQGWYDLYSGKYLEGGVRIKAPAPYERMPVFVKEGSIIPVGPSLQYVAEKPADTITLFIYGDKDAELSLYEDEGANYHYEKGLSATIKIQYKQAINQLIISKREGFFNGMLQHRMFRIVKVNLQHPIGIDDKLKNAKMISYNGEQLKIYLK